MIIKIMLNYSEFQKYLKEKQHPIRHFGKEWSLFIPNGANAFKKDLPNVIIFKK